MLFLNGPVTSAPLESAEGIAWQNPFGVGQEFFRMRKLFSRFLADQSGATAIEYCLIAAGLSIVIVVAVNGIGGQLNNKFTSVNSSLK